MVNKLNVDEEETIQNQRNMFLEQKSKVRLQSTTLTYGTIGVDSALIEDGDDFGFDGGFI